MKALHLIHSIMASIAILVLSLPALAAEFCASDSDQLKSHLETAASNGEHDTIKIAAGYYTPGDDRFWYNSHVAGGDDRNLTLIGGWEELSGDPCGQLLTQHPFATVLDAEGENQVMTLSIGANSSLDVRLLTFMNGNTSSSFLGGGLEIFAVEESDYTGRIIVERNLFLNNEAFNGSGLLIAPRTASGNARIGVVNNAFVGNHSLNCCAAAYISMHSGEAGVLGAGIYVSNNTVVSNTMQKPIEEHRAALFIYGSTPNVYVINNNLWGNGADLRVNRTGGASGAYWLQNNNIGIRSGAPPSFESGNISVEPEFEPCFLCFTWVPTANSPLIDAGIHPPNIAPFWTMPALDAAGNPRVAQGTVDIGAYENHTRLFMDRFELPD